MNGNADHQAAQERKDSDNNESDPRKNASPPREIIIGKKGIYIERPGIIIRKATDMSQGPYTKRYMRRK